METRYLNTLIAAIEAGTFSKAAELLHITQSAASQRIKFLEDYFGKKLLDRSGQRLALTPAGRLVFKKAKDILDKEKELLTCLEESLPTKRLSLCCTPTFGMAYLPQVLSSFIKVHSDLSDLKFVFLQVEQALQGLRFEEFDLAVMEHRLDQDFTGFDRFPMPDDEMAVVVSAKTNLARQSNPVTVSDLKQFRLFARRDGCSSKEVLRTNLLAQGVDFSEFSSVVVSDDLRFTIQSVIDGEGIAYVSRALVSGYLDSGQMAGLQIEGFEHRRGRSVVVMPQKKEDPLVTELLASLFEVVSPHWRPSVVNGSG